MSIEFAEIYSTEALEAGIKAKPNLIEVTTSSLLQREWNCKATSACEGSIVAFRTVQNPASRQREAEYSDWLIRKAFACHHSQLPMDSPTSNTPHKRKATSPLPKEERAPKKPTPLKHPAPAFHVETNVQALENVKALIAEWKIEGLEQHAHKMVAEGVENVEALLCVNKRFLHRFFENVIGLKKGDTWQIHACLRKKYDYKY